MTRKKRPNTFVPTDDQRRFVLHDAVWYEMLYAFGISSYEETDYCAWEHVNFSLMGHARALYYFFETPLTDRQQDDVLCEDFGFPARPIDRPSDDRTRLNKDLFHLTYARCRHAKETKAWPDSIISCLHDRWVEFIQYLLAQKSQFVSADDADQWQSMLNALTSGREIHISRPFLRVGVSQNQEIRWGRQLYTGRGELSQARIQAE